MPDLLPVHDAHLPRHARRHPYRPANTDELPEVLADASVVLAGVGNMVAKICRDVLPRRYRPQLDDVVQEVLLVLHRRSLPKFDARRGAKLSTYLFRCTRFAALEQVHRQLADVLETSQRSRQQPLTVYTTTAGDDPAALWADTFDFAYKVRSGAIDDPEFLPCMWQAGLNDDITDPATWRKAQPNLGVSVTEDEYARDVKKAMNTPSYMPRFKQLSLNLPTDSHAAWIDYQQWKTCVGEVEPQAGAVAYAGCDLASTQDTAAFVMAFPDGDRLLVRPFIFLPEENASGLFKRSKRDKAPYRQWADAGHLILTPGNVIDFDAITAVIVEQSKLFDLREVQMDPHAASSIAAQLQAAGVTVTYVRQGWSLSQACKATFGLIQSGRLVHGDHPVLNWQMSNAVVHTDRLENIWLDKAKSTRRIDSWSARTCCCSL